MQFAMQYNLNLLGYVSHIKTIKGWKTIKICNKIEEKEGKH